MAETTNFLKRKNYLEPARRIVELFNNDPKVDMYFDDEATSAISIELFKGYDRLSYVDANSVVFCWQLKCEYIISFDSGFDGIRNIARLETFPKK